MTKIYFLTDFNNDLKRNMEIKIFNYQNSLTYRAMIQTQNLMIASNCPFRKNSSINHYLLIWSISPIYSTKMNQQVVQVHGLLTSNSPFLSSSRIKSWLICKFQMFWETWWIHLLRIILVDERVGFEKIRMFCDCFYELLLSSVN